MEIHMVGLLVLKDDSTLNCQNCLGAWHFVDWSRACGKGAPGTEINGAYM